jgi:hypothetical protein
MELKALGRALKRVKLKWVSFLLLFSAEDDVYVAVGKGNTK